MMDLNDPRIAALLVSAVDRRVDQIVAQRERQVRYGVVASVDTGNRRAAVYLGGDPNATPGFVFGARRPSVGELVRCEIGASGDFVIADMRGADAIFGGNVTVIGNLTAANVSSSPPIVRTYSADATWTKPAGLAFIVVEVQAPGGGGGGTGATAAGQAAAAGGGGGGGYARKLLAASVLPATCVVDIGVIGAGAAAGANTGGTATPSIFSGTGITTISAGGGEGGFGASGSASSTGFMGGGGGIATGGDVNVRGGSGGQGRCISGSVAMVSSGGGTVLGPQFNNRQSDGQTGTAYGVGGTGAYSGASSSARIGGNGAAGIIIVTEFYGP